MKNRNYFIRLIQRIISMISVHPFYFCTEHKNQVVPILGAMHFAAKIVQATDEAHVRFQLVEGAHHDIHDFEEEWIYDLEAEFLREKLNIGGE